MIIEITIFLITLSIGCLVYKLITTKTIYDKLLITNLIGTHAVLLISLLGIYYKSFYFIDIAIIYALINYIATTVLVKYFYNKKAKG